VVGSIAGRGNLWLWKNIGTISTLIVCTRRSAAIHWQKSAANPSFAAPISTNPGGNLIAVGFISCPLQPDQQFARHTIGSSWTRSLAKAEITHFRFHDLRHTWASWHVMHGTSLQELMELGGWKSYEMVLRYAHLAPEHLADAASRIEKPWETVAENATISLR
jgi:integrase